MKKINVDDKFALFTEHWRPKVAAELNGQQFKLVKFKGEFPMHHHEHEDEMFFVWKGEMQIVFEAHDTVTLTAGEAIVVPKGVLHSPRAQEECQVFLLEPKSTHNTGDIDSDETYTAPKDDWV